MAVIDTLVIESSPIEINAMAMGLIPISVEAINSSPPVINNQGFNTIFMQRAHDSGTGVYVYWTTYGAPDPSPSPTQTSPNYTGTLSVYAIVRLIRTT